MNTKTGKIHSKEEIEKLNKLFPRDNRDPVKMLEDQATEMINRAGASRNDSAESKEPEFYPLAGEPKPGCPNCKGKGWSGRDKEGNVIPCRCVGAGKPMMLSGFGKIGVPSTKKKSKARKKSKAAKKSRKKNR